MEVFMTYQEFENEIVEKINKNLPEGHQTAVKPVDKNNGVVLHGLIINNGLCNISPTIYLDYYYDEYQKGHSIESLSEQIITQYQKFALEEDFDITLFTDYEKCSKNISYKLINYEKNKTLLQDIPHIVYLDLAIVFYCLINSNPFETSSILIRNSHIKHWNVTVDELFEVASNNTPRLLESDIMNLNDLVSELLSKNPDIKLGELTNEDILNEDSSMYVLTNKIKLYGACCILYKNLLEEFASKIGSDLYIIPSSVHEVLLLPKTIEYDDEYLSSLVKEVNSIDLSTEDILSDHVYYYSRQDDAITY